MSRPSPPSMRVERDVALRMLGYTRADVDLDHSPALGLRERTPDGGYIPDADDPDFLIFRPRASHKIKTFGRGGEKRITTAGSDIGDMAKMRRLKKKQAEFRIRLLSKGELVYGTGDNPPHKTKRGRKLQGRPFGKQHRPMNRS